MWRHRARDHSTRHRPLPIYWWSFGTKPVSPAVFEILASKSIGAKTLTFQGHVASSDTWPFNSQVAISYRRFIVTKSLSAAISEKIGTKHIGVTTLTFQGHVTSSVTWPFDSQGPISYCHEVDICSHFRDNGHQSYWGHDIALSGSRDVIGHVIIRFPYTDSYINIGLAKNFSTSQLSIV